MNRVAPVSASHYIKVKIATTLATVKLRLANNRSSLPSSIVPNFAYELQCYRAREQNFQFSFVSRFIGTKLVKCCYFSYRMSFQAKKFS